MNQFETKTRGGNFRKRLAIFAAAIVVFGAVGIFASAPAGVAQAAAPTVSNVTVTGTGPYSISWAVGNVDANAVVTLQLVNSSSVVGNLVNAASDVTTHPAASSPYSWNGAYTTGVQSYWIATPVPAGSSYQVSVVATDNGVSSTPATSSTFSLAQSTGRTQTIGTSGTVATGGGLVSSPSAVASMQQLSDVALTCAPTGITCFIVSVVTDLTNILDTLFRWIFTTVVMPMMLVLLTISPHTIQFAAVILQGWVVVRNILNIVFVLALLFVGLMTLFGLGNFDPQQWLVKIVTNAILINFSLVIAQAILGVADTLQAQFLPSNSDALKVIGASLIGSQGKAMFTGSFASAGNYSTAVSAILGAIIAFFILLVMVAITAMLAYRIVMLWILLLLSPAAYALNVVPVGGVSKYAGMWWHEFICWSFFTPIMALGVTLTWVISQTVQQFLVNGANVAFPGTVSSATSAAATVTYNILSMCIILGLLYGFEKAAKSGACGAAGVIVDKVSSYGHNTLKGKGAFSTANSLRNTVAGAAAGAGAKLSTFDSKNKYVKGLVQGLGSGLSGTGNVLTYNQKVAAQMAGVPGIRLLTKAGREKSAVENEAALKDIQERRMTGVGASEHYKAVQKEATSKAMLKYADKTAAELNTYLASANDKEKEIIIKAAAESGKLETMIKENNRGALDGSGKAIPGGLAEYNAANIRKLVENSVGPDAANGILTGMSKVMKKKHVMLGVELDPNFAKKSAKEQAETLQDEFDSLPVEEKLKINVKGLSEEGKNALRGKFQDTYKNASIDEQRKVSGGAKEWSGIKKFEDAYDEAHKENDWRDKVADKAAKKSNDDAKRAEDKAHRDEVLATAKRHADAMEDIASKLKP